ncbi:MAG: hypothetical protein NC489_38160, partial [Ruminococcus flavefaciens]|nr:hypothetical protein [Ruminococcus flavefaciens]
MFHKKNTDSLQKDKQEDVSILKGDVILKLKDEAVFVWRQEDGRKEVLEFDKRYQISRKNFDQGIHDCAYSVRGRQFLDLSWMQGEKLMETDDACEVRVYPDGRKFIFHESTKPVFDEGDREWD